MKRFRYLIAGIMLALGIAGASVPAIAADTELTGKSAMEITELMGVGWNLGNTLDATGTSYTGNVYNHEKYWGNPQITETLIKGVKAAGFNTIRIPVTWYTELDGSYQIKKEFLDRVQQVVDMAISQDMFVILNVHHEKWINTTSLATNVTAIGNELAAVWKQLAERFASYDQHLIFEGMNEPRYEGASNEWSGDEAGYMAVNYLNQIFVTTVRANTKGHNSERCLMCPQYAASNSGAIMNYWTLPTAGGRSAGNIIVSVHGYAPYNFCLSDAQSSWSAGNSNDTADINAMFANINEKFLSQGIAVVIGETGATNTNNNSAARAAWAKYMGEMSKSYGVPIVIWDNGVFNTSGGECHGWFNRNTGKVTDTYAAAVTNLMSGYKSKTWASARKTSSSETKSLVGASVLWQNKAGVSVKAWNSGTVYIASSSSFYIQGSDLVIVYKGNDGVCIVLDSEAKQKWWMAVDPYKTANVNGYNVAYFSKASIDSVLKNNGITDYSQLRNLCVVTKGTESIYEIGQTGSKNITCIANGRVYYTGTALPSTSPSYTGMTFLGWYKDKLYKTKYEGGTLTESITVYAKFCITGSEQAEDELPFVDIKKDGWYVASLKTVFEKGLISGLDSTHFGPYVNLSRAMVVTILYRHAGSPAVSSSVVPFPDVKISSWAIKAICWAKQNNIVGGYNDGTFGPSDSVKRQDFVKILYFYAKFRGLNVAVSNPDSYRAAADYANVSGYAAEYVNWAYEKGLIGVGSNLNPKAFITRAEAVTVLARFLDKYKI